MPGANEPFGRVYYQWSEPPQPGNTFLDNEFNSHLGMWQLINVQPGNTLVNVRIIEIQIIDAGLPTATALFTGEASALGARGPRSDAVVIDRTT